MNKVTIVRPIVRPVEVIKGVLAFLKNLSSVSQRFLSFPSVSQCRGEKNPCYNLTQIQGQMLAQ